MAISSQTTRSHYWKMGIVTTVVAVLGVTVALVGIRGAFAGGQQTHGPYSLEWDWFLGDWGGGTYYGDTYAWVQAGPTPFYRVATGLVLEEFCNTNIQTDYENTFTQFNQGVPLGQGISQTAGYADDIWDCLAGQAIMHDTNGSGGPAVWFYDTAPYFTDIEKNVFICKDIRAGGFCP